MTKPLLRKIKLLTFFLLILTSTLMISFSFLPEVKAETRIISIAPQEGIVGTTVQFGGNITSENKQYIVQFDGVDVASGNATGYEVNATFNVPNTFAGNHNVTLIDVTTGENNTTTFMVLTSYFLEIDVPESPKQLQENAPIPISVNITGGESSKTYVANITVQAPTNASYTKLLDVVTSDIGSGSATMTYPDANTNFTGEYEIFFNTTLATQTFIIGLTNSTIYHRFDCVNIKAAGYKPNENVTVTISFGGEKIPPEENVTATEGGIIYANWSVPSNASIGTYTVNITSTSLSPTRKEPPDIQNFTVPGFDVNITTRNLAEEPVPNVTIRIFENEKLTNETESGSDGLATIKLETGNYTSKACFKNQTVGERWINVTDVASLDFYCNLTNLRILVIAVADETEILMPEVEIYLTPENQTLTTDIIGTAVAHSLLPNVTYGLNALRYGMQFNDTTIPGLLVNETAIAWFNVSIICPTLTLQINVTNPNANDQPISNAMVKVQELMGGICCEGNTKDDGAVTFSSTFGMYRVEVYDENGIKLNETILDLFQNRNISISCKLYGLTISIKVVDYFGQPIPNANVTWQRNGLQDSCLTKSDGVATFSNVVGGDSRIAVYLLGQSQPFIEKAIYVDASATIEIKVDKFVVLAGFLVETRQLTTVIIIVVAVILFLSIEFYRKKRLKPQKSEG